MQANRAMCFQKNCTKPERIGEAFINAFIANAVGDGSWRISGLVDTAHHAIENGIVYLPSLQRLSACLPNPSYFPSLEPYRTWRETGRRRDGTMPIVVRATRLTKATKVIAIQGIVAPRLKPTRKIAAGYRNDHRNGFDSSDAEKIAECGGKMMRMASIIRNPYIWHVLTCDEIADAFSYLIAGLKDVTAYGMKNRPIREIPTD